MPNRAPPELKELTLLVGKFIQHWGFKRVHGQIWTYIYLAKQPVDATTLVKRLGVSKALVSMAIKDLVKYDVIRAAGKSGRRKILFVSHPNPSEVICRILQDRELQMIQDTLQACKNLRRLKSDEKCDMLGARLDELEAMVEMADQTLKLMISTKLCMISYNNEE